MPLQTTLPSRRQSPSLRIENRASETGARSCLMSTARPNSVTASSRLSLAATTIAIDAPRRTSHPPCALRFGGCAQSIAMGVTSSQQGRPRVTVFPVSRSWLRVPTHSQSFQHQRGRKGEDHVRPHRHQGNRTPLRQPLSQEGGSGSSQARGGTHVGRTGEAAESDRGPQGIQDPPVVPQSAEGHQGRQVLSVDRIPSGLEAQRRSGETEKDQVLLSHSVMASDESIHGSTN